MSARLRALQAQVPPGSALLAVDPANVSFATGLTSMSELVYRDTPLWAVVSGDGLQVIASAMDVVAIHEYVDAGALQPYGKFHVAGAGTLDGLLSSGRTVAEAIVAAARELDVGGSLVADSALPQVAAQAIRALLGDDRLEVDPQPFERARARKDDDALACLEAANRLAESAIEASLGEAGAGSTEREIAAGVRQRIIAGGGHPTLHVVAIGERSALPEPWPGDRALRVGDAIRLDVGCTVQGWHADCARTAVCGDPDEWLAQAHAAIVAGQDAALASIRPGVPVAELYHQAVAATRRAGLSGFDRHHCGHGIGLSVYEGFEVTPSDATVLAERNVLCVETPYYDLRHAGVQIEDAVVVTGDGHRRLGALERELLRVPPRTAAGAPMAARP